MNNDVEKNLSLYACLFLILFLGLTNCASQEVASDKATAVSSPEKAEVAAKPGAASESAHLSVKESLAKLETGVKEMQTELALVDKEIKSQKSGRKKLKKESQALARTLAAAKKKLQERHAQIDKMSSDEAALKEKDADLKKLEETQNELAKTAPEEAQANQVASQLRDKRDKIQALEKEIKKLRQKIANLERAESESKVADSVLSDRQDTLKDLEARLKAKEAQLDQKTLDEQNKREQKEAKRRINRAEAEQLNQRKLASSQPAVSLQLIRKTPAAAKTAKTKRKGDKSASSHKNAVE